ncbi:MULTISPECIES: helix-turn-helix transcriptional regulator [unclassified Bradyrhizobium]|uniref:response regulator transcription factor n=1 Tax=unclassified Bradyrhizobium TaxID=2631580 RepID=UPI002448B410|nr:MULTISPECIES: helix-turn-helix transcriptional regulator [unclassified Bradyrhizobium]MDH2346134.1 helix-turn-helix transcriptional regulator [Bradyrhizobium sp. SSUT77]MDH2350492.1 helix-turn-helix transcriptional regulator [Bradyrhizobium sp. SSUT112]
MLIVSIPVCWDVRQIDGNATHMALSARMTISLSARELTLLKRVSEGLLQPLPSDWLLTRPDLATDLLRLLSMDFVGTTNWNRRAGRYENAACSGRGLDMARAYVEEFQRCDPISPRLRPRRGPTPIYSVINRSELERTRYYNEFLRVHQTTDGIDLHLYDGNTNVGDFRFWRAPCCVPIGSREVALLTLLQPILLRATKDLYHRTNTAAAGHPFPQLTPRENQVVALVADGLKDRTIAQNLGIGYWTVRSHLDHIFQKLEISNRAGLIARVHRERH